MASLTQAAFTALFVVPHARGAQPESVVGNVQVKEAIDTSDQAQFTK